MQLDLFEHAPRHYHESLQRLGELDLAGCREALRRHRSSARAGSDPQPVERALEWLERHLPGPRLAPGERGWGALELCRGLRAGVYGGTPVPELLRPGSGPGRRAVRRLAGQALQWMAQANAVAEDPLGAELPWGVFLLLAGKPEAARQALLHFLQRRGPSAVACLALGEACAACGREDEARCAWREGCGMHPDPDWAPWPAWLAQVRRDYRGDPEFDGPWWAVGAYLDGRFPRYRRAEPVLVVRRWQRFATAGEAIPAAGRFFAGLFLSEHGDQLPAKDRAGVRRVLAALHPEAYRQHRDLLEEQGPPATPANKPYFAW